ELAGFVWESGDGERLYTPDLSVSIVVEKEEEKRKNGLGGKTVNSAQCT
nr:hypothetical protein [Tanacetum cinerariifolium]